MLFADFDIHLLTPREVAQEEASAMGSLAVRVDDADRGTKLARHCSAFLVSPRHLLTAGHCVRPNLVFDQQHVAAREDLYALQIVNKDGTLRLRFDGETLSTPAYQSSLETLGEPAYVDDYHDFAVYSLSQPRTSAFIDLRAVDVAGTGELALYGYPNGVPLARAANCHAISSRRPDILLHDCDSMKGSSGGLLMSVERGAPVALHLRAPGKNDSEYFERTGHFELWSDFRDDRERPLYNKALALTFVVRSLEEHAPSLWAEISSASKKRQE